MTEKWGGFKRIQRPRDLIFINDNFTPHVYSSVLTAAIQQMLANTYYAQRVKDAVPLWVRLFLVYRGHSHYLLVWTLEKLKLTGGNFGSYSSLWQNECPAKAGSTWKGSFVYSLRAHRSGEGLRVRVAVVWLQGREVAGASICSPEAEGKEYGQLAHFLLFPPFIQSRTAVHGMVLLHSSWVFPLQLELSGSPHMYI